MLKFSHATLIYLSGLIWLAVGVMLLRIGILLLFQGEKEISSLPLASFISSISGEEMAMGIIALAGMLIGCLKGRFVLGKSAHKGIQRILTFPNPTSIGNIYNAKYYILLFLMVGLGMSIKYLGIPDDIRGFIDMAIGIALFTGSMIYFREASKLVIKKLQSQGQ